MDLKYSKATDTAHVIKLESALVSATWRAGAAPAGQSVPFEVRTSFVGNGAAIKIKGKSENGKKLGKLDDVIKNNVYVGELTIPDDIKIDDLVYFEVDLPKNGLSGQSNRIPVTLPITVTNLKWSAKEAHRGDILTLSADVSGCRDHTDAKITIFEYDHDNAHDRIVQIPTTVMRNKIEVKWEYEYHEDTDEIPTNEELKKYGKSYNPPEYFFVVEIDGQKFGEKQESGLLTFKDWIEIQLVNFVGGETYTMYLPDGTKRTGKFDNEGYIKEDKILPGKYEIVIDTGNKDEDDEKEVDI